MSLRRTAWIASLAAVVLLLSGRESVGQSVGQYLVLYPGSTVHGDWTRGEGVFYMGLGQFNLHTAMALSIDSDRLIREATVMNLAAEQAARNERSRLANQIKRAKRAQSETLARHVEAPTVLDVSSGDALNALVRKLADLGGASPSTLRAATVPVPGGTIEQAPLMLASKGVTISRSRLLDRGEWPILLRTGTFDLAFREYRQAVEQALERANQLALRVEDVARVDQSAQALKGRLEKVAPEANPADAREARAFLRHVEHAVAFLHIPQAETALSEMLTYGGTTVGDLVEFLTRSKLQFSPAVTPSEQRLYRVLHPLLARQWQTLQATTVAQK